MHRHGYIGQKFGRERDQRNALKRGLMISLILNKSIKTTLPKAKEIRRPMEKLITIAKKGDLASRRRVIADLGGNYEVAGELVDKIAPKIKRSSGYLRVVKLDESRVGDNAPMARIEFVDEFNSDKQEDASSKSSQDDVIANREERSGKQSSATKKDSGSPRRTSSARDDSKKKSTPKAKKEAK